MLMQVFQYLYSAVSIQKVLVKCDTKRPNSVFHTAEMIKVEILQFLPGRSLNHLLIRAILNLLWDFFPPIYVSLSILMIKITCLWR